MNQTDDPVAHYLYAQDLVRGGRYADAIEHFERAIALDPDHLDAEVYTFAAWMLATCPNADLRDGTRAVKYAREACEITDWEPQPLSALAAAFAESGDFSSAVEAQKRAIELYCDYTHLEAAYRQKCQDRLARYEARQPPEYDPEP